MSALHRKLLRDLVRLWPQALAIALVMAAGAATLILGVGAHGSLAETRAAYYERNRFADVFVNLTRAPNIVVAELRRIPGVAAVETRIAKLALLDLPDMSEPASAMFISIPDVQEQQLNLLYLRSGRLPIPGDEHEVVVSEPFANAHKFTIGSTFEAILNGRKRSLRVVGTALSPEFIYTLGPGALMPDDRRFGVVWMSERALAAAFNSVGAFTSASFRLLRGASESAVIEQIDTTLARYGGLGAYGRKDQVSHAFLNAELNELAAMSRILPPIFLVVAAFLVNMTLGRLITLEREQIGLLKALGYTDVAVGTHYLLFALVVAIVGALIGVALGTWLGFDVTTFYANFFHFPFLVFRTDPSIYLVAAGVAFATTLIGAVRAVREAVRLLPAVAMSPPAPARYRRTLPAFVYDIVHLPESFVMVSRHLLRWPARSLSSVIGVALSVAILVSSLWVFGAIDLMINVTFHWSDRQDATVNFAQEKRISAVWAVAKLPGVLEAEPYRAVPVKIRFGHIERRTSIMGRLPHGDLNQVLDDHFESVTLPESGIALSDMLARLLGVHVGDLVEIELLERDRRRLQLPVTEVIQGYLGLTAYMDLHAINALMREGAMVTGVHIAFDHLRYDDLFRALKATPAASFVTLRRAALEKFRETMAESMLFMISIYVALAGVIAFGVVYNFARIALSEQGRELASLRVLGFSKAHVSRILFTELAIIAIVAQPFGWIIGYGFAWALVKGLENELYRVPLVVETNVYAYGTLVVVAAALISGLVVLRRINRLDLIQVLKTRE